MVQILYSVETAAGNLEVQKVHLILVLNASEMILGTPFTRKRLDLMPLRGWQPISKRSMKWISRKKIVNFRGKFYDGQLTAITGKRLCIRSETA